MTYKEQIEELLSDPQKLIQKKPFTRGLDDTSVSNSREVYVDVSDKITASLPTFRSKVVSQEQFMRELDPYCHDVLFDENLPSVCVKIGKEGYRDIKFVRMAIPLQRLIRDEQTIYLTRNPMEFTLVDLDPTEEQQKNFITFKQYWELRNQDGMRNKMVKTQLSYGDAGLLYYFDYKGEIKSRLLSYQDGYILCPHNDQNGDRILESVYYIKDNVEYIDSYDDTYMYRYTNDTTNDNSEKGTWVRHEPIAHGFEEIPLITKRGNVAWDGVQNDIECFEELYNVFITIQKKHGWGIFYVKGKFKDNGKRIAGNVVLNDTSLEGKGDAKFLAPPSPDGMMDTLKFMLRTIQMSASTTFILPDDIRLSGDVSGLAVQLTKELDIQNAAQKVISWQNVADKMQRLFKYGLAKELVNKGEEGFNTAITSFATTRINAKFREWRPFNETEYNNMLLGLVGGGVLSQETGTEINTLSKPDEKSRIKKEKEQALAEKQALMQKQIENAQSKSNENPSGKETQLEKV